MLHRVAVDDEGTFYRRWIVANGLAEGGGLGTTFVLGQAIAPALEQVTGVAPILGSALAAVALGTLLEGVLVGAAQGRVLRGRISRLRPGAWIVATAIGAGAAWALGMIPSTVIAMTAREAPRATVSEPGALVQYALAVALGFATGPVLGIAQWMLLRRFVNHAERWLWANAVAWGFGMPLIFVGMDHVPWSGPAAARIGAIYGICAAAGFAVGAIHGRALVRLLRTVRKAAV